MSIKESIGWTDKTWNPIKGICPVGCWYCYARKIYERFGWNPEIRIADEFPGMIFMPLSNFFNRKVFVCSTFELFHPSVKKEWRDWIFDVIEYNDKHTFQILTKFPQNIDRPMPDNVWLGVSITKNEDIYRRNRLVLSNAKIKFISFEPLFENLDFHLYQKIDWVIVGRLTGHGKKYDPKRVWIKKIVANCKDANIPIFLKDNLKEIWGEELIQEFPKC